MKSLLVIGAALAVVGSASTFAAGKSDGWAMPMGNGTALDAARRLFPGATGTQDGSLELQHGKVLRLPGTTKTRAQLPSGTELSEPTALRVRSEGKAFTLLFWEGTRPDASDDGGFGEDVAILAVFPAGSIDATDVVEVKQDKDTYLDKGPILGGEDSFTILNAHQNSSQGFANTDLFRLWHGRVQRIASVFTLSGHVTCEETFQEDLQWRAVPDGAGPPRILALRELTHAPRLALSGCEHRPKTRTEHFQDSYRWNASRQRYVYEGGNSDALDKWNDQHR